MIFRSLAGKIWMIIIAWVFLVLLIFGGILAKSTHDFYYGYADEENEELTDTALTLSSYLATLPSIQAAKEEFAFLGTIFQYDLLATDPTGKVIISTHRLRDWTNTVLPPEDMQHIQKGERISFSGNAPYGTQRILKVATPIEKDGKLIGAVFVIEPLTYLEAVGISVNSSVRWGLTLSFLLILPLGLFVAKRVANPVVEMDKAIRDIATGNYNRLLPLSTTDELASLGQSVNTLSEEIRIKLQEIARERQQLANILVSIADGVLTLSPTREIIIANRIALQQFGTESGSTALKLTNLPESLRSFLLAALTEPVSHQGEFKLGDQVFSVETSPLLTEHECGGLVAVWHDVTKERQLEALRRDFVSDVSHELRTPLSYLQGYSEALLDGMITDEDQQQRYLETIHSQTLRLRRLVNELLDLNRIEFGGSLELPHEEVSVPYIMSRIKQQIGPAALAKQVTLPLDFDNDLPLVDCGTDRLEQILLNLVDNALRFSPQGGKITISGHKMDHWVEISITDEGPGLPQEEQVLIWNRFERGRDSQGNQGTGLGLAIVKSLVQAYHGQVWVSSKPGRGSTFSLRLPGINKN
ncbi:MAG: sensor histidine kinase [Desulfitobacteriaceae bacterium]